MKERMSAEEYRRVVGLDKAEPVKNKLNAQRTEFNGRIYASKKEANRAYELWLLQQAGKILSFIPQVRIPLSEKSNSHYVVDFVIVHRRLTNGNYEISFEDPTGHTTSKKKLNLQMMKDNYGIEVKTF